MRKYYNLNPLVYENVRKLFPWQDKVGGPGFPENYLWKTLNCAPDVLKTERRKRDYQVIGEKGHDKVGIEFSVVPLNQGIITYTNNGNVEGIITLTYTQNPLKLILAFHSDLDPNADVNINLSIVKPAPPPPPPKPPQATDLDFEIKFNNKTFQSKYTFGSNEIPQEILDFAKEISNYQSTIEIAAGFAVGYPIYGEAYKESSALYSTRDEDLACAAAIVIADMISSPGGAVASGATFLVNLLILQS